VKKYFILTISTFLFLVSCQTSEEKTGGQISVIVDSVPAAVREKLHRDSLACAGLLGRSLENEGLFKAFCPNDTVKGIPVSSRKTHRLDTLITDLNDSVYYSPPFDTLITKTKDTLYYSFKVSSECCVKYYGMFFAPDDDTILLTYGYCGDVCDCYCDYVLTFKIPLKRYKFKKIELSNLDFKTAMKKRQHRS
jgi:hypothetical protein